MSGASISKNAYSFSKYPHMVSFDEEEDCYYDEIMEPFYWLDDWRRAILIK